MYKKIRSGGMKGHGHGKTIWHLCLADYFAAKSLIFFVALVYLASVQLGALKMMGDNQFDKPAIRTELALGGDKTLFILKDGKYIPINEREIADAVKDKAVIFHPDKVVTSPDYGSEYVRLLALMQNARAITPGNAINIAVIIKRGE